MDQFVKKRTVSDQAASNGVSFDQIGPIVSEHGLVCTFGTNVVVLFGPLRVHQNDKTQKFTPSSLSESNGEKNH